MNRVEQVEGSVKKGFEAFLLLEVLQLFIGLILTIAIIVLMIKLLNQATPDHPPINPYSVPVSVPPEPDDKDQTVKAFEELVRQAVQNKS